MENSDYKQSIIETFNKASAKYNEIGTPFFTYFGEKLVEYAQVKPSDKILDIACGKGASVLPAFRQLNGDGAIVGIDFSPEMIDFCRYEYMALQQAQFMVMDAEQMDFPDQAFDKVTCGFGIFFFENLGHALQGIDRVLKKNGRFIFSTWARQKHFEWLYEKMKQYADKKNGAEQKEADNQKEETDFSSDEGLKNIIQKAGWTCHDIVTESTRAIYKDEDELLDFWWNTGVGNFLSRLSEEEYAEFKTDAYNMMQPYKQNDQLAVDYTALMAIAEK
jgi:ubiquinone/menaquinone biosynthesis C-methylase UbiE